MLSLILLSIGLISANLPYINTVTVDNQNDAECFTRIYKEAMIPPNRVFRTSETNSLRVCKEQCMEEGQRCQTFALGISSAGGGNGTCQLSGDRVFENAGRRPRNTIYDPNFNLYQRKENCGITDNNEMPPKDEEMPPPTMITIQTDMPSDRPQVPVITTSTSTTNTNTMMSSSGEIDREPTIQTTSDTSSTNDMTSSPVNSMSTNPSSVSDKPDSTSTENHNSHSNPSQSTFSSSMPTTNMYPNTVDNTKMPSPPTVMTTMDRFPSTSTTYGSTNPDLSTNEVKPPTYPTIYMTSNKPDDFNYPYPPQYHNKYNYYHEIYPVYTYPTFYESSYPSGYMPGAGASSSGASAGSGYAPNVPTLSYQPDIDYYGTTPSMSSYGGGSTIPNTASTYMGNGWSNAGDTNRRQQNGGRYPDRDNSGSYPEGKYNGTRTPATVPYIRTYFNPDFYLKDTTKKPNDDVNSGSNKYDYRPSPTLATQRPCFRRALAGKRVAPQWVRRTLTCERVEDCQVECGLEKRFSCEGFNYRLDPSGQGQGICELIDVPLAEMDLYSSPSRRDEVLLYHPDYDYYERDRNACRPSFCKDCGSGSSGKPYLPRPDSRPDSHPPTKYFPEPPPPPPSSYNSDDRDHPPSHSNHSPPHSGGKPYLPTPSDYNTQPTTYRPIDNFKPYSDSRPSYESGGSDYHSSDRFQPPYENTAIDKYRPSPFDYPQYERPSPPDRGYDYNRYDVHSHYSSTGYRTPDFDLERYDNVKPIDRPIYSEIAIYSDPPPNFPRPPSGYSNEGDYHTHRRPPPPHPHPPNDYPGPYKPPHDSTFSSFGYRPKKPEYYPNHNYLDRERESPPPGYKPPKSPPQSRPFIPYTINKDSWATYGGSYGGAQHYNQQAHDFWGLTNDFKRNEGNFNYFNLGNGQKVNPNDNSVLSYPGSRYDGDKGPNYENDKDKSYYGSLWTRRPGQDDCSVKSSEGFRLHKAVIRFIYNVPTVTECERMCFSETKFRCVTYSYKYSPQTRDNCLLCDRPMSHLDFYTDLEPNRDYDIYSMSDDLQMCNQESNSHGRQENNAQCFFRAIDLTRFYKSIVRDSLTVRSIGECELECIKTSKFTCRAFSFRYGPKTPGSIIDNCQLTDWPVRDMDTSHHLINDNSFDVYERASYGRGCEIQPISDEKHKQLCYLGYGSPAKLLSSAIKKVISVPTELDCKNECIRYRENTPFKCHSFSFGSQASSFNCEMSDLDQSELKQNVHYARTNDRDYWLFSWVYDYTCRDKVATIGGSNRANNDRRMDIFREKDGENTWSHFTVSGKACRTGSTCGKNLVTGFYSCEIDGDEVGAWDYCCKADYPCGYSQGFDYPWCFVGEGPDQWRTCSDRYYPMNTGSNSNPVSSSSNTNSNKKKTSPISYTSNKRKGTNTNDAYHQQPPRPGGLQNLEDIASARLWPITYLYSSGPPNSTDLSNFVDCNKESC